MFAVSKHRFSLFLLLSLIMLVSVFSLAGCGNNQKATDESSSSAVSSAAPSESTAPASTQTAVAPATIDVWGWETEEQQKPEIEAFNKVYPDLTIKMTLTEAADMPVRIQTALASGSEMPDICWIEMGVRGKMLALDCWDDLTKAPYNVDKSELWDSMIPLATNEKGEFVGLDDGPSMAGLAYKRGMTTEYFGTDDPKALEAMFANWDSVIQKGLEVKQKSGGKIFMFASLTDIMTMLKGQSNIPFIKCDTLNRKEALGPSFDLLIKMKESGIVDTMDQWSPAWNACIAEQKHIFMPCPYWGPTWIIKQNDKEGKNKWGLMVPPGGGYPWGGTCWSVPKTAVDKEAAATFMRWCYLSEDGGKVRRDAFGYTIPLKRLYTEEANFYTKPDEAFGGQDILKYFTTAIVSSVSPSRQVCKYDSEISDALNLAVTTLNASKKAMTTDQLLKIMSDDIIKKVPALKAE